MFINLFPGVKPFGRLVIVKCLTQLAAVDGDHHYRPACAGARVQLTANLNVINHVVTRVQPVVEDPLRALDDGAFLFGCAQDQNGFAPVLHAPKRQRSNNVITRTDHEPVKALVAMLILAKWRVCNNSVKGLSHAFLCRMPCFCIVLRGQPEPKMN